MSSLVVTIFDRITLMIRRLLRFLSKLIGLMYHLIRWLSYSRTIISWGTIFILSLYSIMNSDKGLQKVSKIYFYNSLRVKWNECSTKNIIWFSHDRNNFWLQIFLGQSSRLHLQDVWSTTAAIAIKLITIILCFSTSNNSFIIMSI